MKVLFVVPYFYSDELDGFGKNKTGFGILLDRMIENIGNDTELYVFTNILTKEKKYKKAVVLSHTIYDVFLHIGIKNFINGVKAFFKTNGRLNSRIKQLYYNLNCGYLSFVIKKLSPDVIHCHGVGDACILYNSVCYDSNKPVVTTLHGLNAQLCDDGASKYKSEIDFLRWAERKNAPVTVISTGIKKRLSEAPWKLKNKDNIRIITNGTDINQAIDTFDGSFIESYNIPKDYKIAIVVGSVYPNKNQSQILRALSLIPKDERKLVVLICGNDATNGKFQEEINKYGLNDSVYMLGFLNKSEINSVYQIADFNILASIQEGFGMSIIEAFLHGVPSLTFSDLDAVEDLYNEKCMKLCYSRADEAFAESIKQMIKSEWNSEWIKAYSKQFSLENMAQKYIDTYRDVIGIDKK